MLTVVILLFSAASVSQAYPDGAPDLACRNMMPLHGTHQPQDGVGSYTLMTEVADEGIYVMLTTSGEKMFEGFLVQGRDAITGEPIGTLTEVQYLHALQRQWNTLNLSTGKNLHIRSILHTFSLASEHHIKTDHNLSVMSNNVNGLIFAVL